MRILITNNRLDLRGGAESFVRDLARGLQSLGHSVVAYSSDLNQKYRLLTYDQVPVTTDLAKLPFKPDIIHAQHHLDTMTALAALPDVPAVYHCHGAVWRDRSPRHPSIQHYLAMSRTLAERMSVEENISPADISVYLNSVELGRFNKIRSLPEKPVKALFYSPNHGESSPLYEAVKEACERCHLKLDAIGYHFSNMINNPQEVLAEYDIVFASGRSAIDAMASGCSVVVIGATGSGPLVRMENYERLRQVNFSIPINSPPPLVDKIAAELQQYSAKDGKCVTERLREDADSSRAVEMLVTIYEKAIQQFKQNPPDAASQMLALSDYMRTLVPLIKMVDDAQSINGMPAYKTEAVHELRHHLLHIYNIMKHC